MFASFTSKSLKKDKLANYQLWPNLATAILLNNFKPGTVMKNKFKDENLLFT